jgi:hypothetical protein
MTRELIRLDSFNDLMSRNFDIIGNYIKEVFIEKFAVNERSVNEILIVIEENIKVVGMDIINSLIKVWNLIELDMEKMENHQNENRQRFEEYNRYIKETYENDNVYHKIMVKN